MGGMSGDNKTSKKMAGTAATMAGILEIAFFHPFDTAAKRLMSHQHSVRGDNWERTMKNTNEVLFKHYADSSTWNKVKFMYPGSTYAVLYKVLQRVYKFAGQPIVRDSFTRVGMTDAMAPVFGKKSKMMTESLAGSVIGIGEIVLLPLDRLKVLSQTNDTALGNRSLVSIMRKEGMGMYAGAGVTAMRNAPGSFCLFGGTAFTKDVVFGLEDYSKATFFQNACASLVGSCLSITITNPMDVVKTRIQNKNFGETHTSAQIVAEIMKKEGGSAFFKGLTPKVTASAPKLVFAYTMTEFFISRLKKREARRQAALN